MSDRSYSDVSSAQAPARAPDSKRRRFLMAFGAGAAGVASASALAAAPAVAATPPQDPSSSPGYRESEHVRSYYATTRL